MKKSAVRLCAAVTGLFLLLAGCGREPESPAYHKITAEEGRELMADGGVTVVDVRRADEYESGHIPGAVHIPNESIGETRPEGLPDQDAKIIVYCRTGVRSRAAADKLTALGYTDVYDMGGIADWPYDTVEGREPGVYPLAGE